MGRRTLIAVVNGTEQLWGQQLRRQEYDVIPFEQCDGPEAAVPDLVLIDAKARGDVIAHVRACRRRFPSPAVPVLVLGLRDPAAGTAAIDAGATDAPTTDITTADAAADADAGPRFDAHVRRVLRAGDAVRGQIDAQLDTRRHPAPEALVRAAADVAKPLGQMLDELEAVIARTGSPDAFDTLLEQIDRAVDALDRLRRMAPPGEEKSG